MRWSGRWRMEGFPYCSRFRLAASAGHPARPSEKTAAAASPTDSQVGSPSLITGSWAERIGRKRLSESPRLTAAAVCTHIPRWRKSPGFSQSTSSARAGAGSTDIRWFVDPSAMT